jgi:glycosyltransferase involved in cell wall biosynthesis
MKVHFCLADLHGPGYYRGYLPLSRMSELGHDCTHATSMPSFEACQEQELDVLVGQRLVEPSPSSTWQDMARESSRNYALVMDLDDDLWNIDRSNDAHSFFDADRLRRLKENVEVADLITVSTDYLANVVDEHTSAPVVVLANTVPQLLVDMRPVHVTNDREGHQVIGEDDLVIGWAGSSTHNRDFGECAKSVRRVVQANPRTIFHCICSVDYTDRVKSIKGRTHWTGWVNGVENYYRAVNFDIGLAPLYPFEFNQSKSDIRLLELGALGIPVIASPVGPYQRAAIEGYPTRMVETPKAWTEALTLLVNDQEERERLGKAGREWVRSRTTEANVHQWVAAYTQVVAGVHVG